MRCIKCNRPCIRFALTVQTKAGILGWGPTCARKVQRLDNQRVRVKVVRGDDRQLDWVGV